MSRKSNSIIDFFDIEATYVTEFRRLLHRLMNNKEETKLKSLMLTSSILSEGKSTVSSFLGLTAAVKKEYKTLIIDTDLRRPSIARFFNLNPEFGVKDILSEQVNYDQAIINSGVKKLDIITAGNNCLNPSELFSAEKIEQMVNELKYTYDLILLDSAPLLPVSDPMMLASKVDGVLMIVKAGNTQKDVIRRALNLINAPEINLMGVVLNNLNHSLPKYYDYGYYKYEYKQYSPKGAKTKNKTAPKSDKKRTKIDSDDSLINKQQTP